MGFFRRRAQQPQPVSAQVELPAQVPRLPPEMIARFPTAADWQKKLDEFWERSVQAIQEAQNQTAQAVNANVVYSVNTFKIYAQDGIPQPMFALDSTGVKLGDVLVINTPGRKVYIGAGEYNDPTTPFYIDTEGFFSLGDSLTWDPDTDTLTITGTINATSGTIGGFSIGADFIRDVANSFGLASTVTGGDDVRFWAGDTFANRATAAMRITEAGNLFANYIRAGGIGIGTVPTVGEVGIQMAPTLTAVSGITFSMNFTTSHRAGVNGDLFLGTRFEETVVTGAFTGLDYRAIHLRPTIKSGGGTIDNCYGLYVEAQTIGTANWSIWVNGGVSHFGGGIRIGVGTLISSSVALTNGAAAAGGTLLNAPAAGNPTKWVPIDDNGTTRYIPCW
jgi:hypothetical protein